MFVIDELSQAQKDRMPEVRETCRRWAYDCSPMDKEKAKAAINLVYEKAGFKPPRDFIFVDDPVQGCYEAAKLKYDGDEEKAKKEAAYLIYDAFSGSFSWSWLVFYYFLKVENLADVSLYEGMFQAAMECGFWWPFEEIAVVSPKPTRIFVDDQARLHCDDGSALEYPSGWKQFAVHGIYVDEKIIMRPETLTTDEIEKQENVEIRRIMLEKFGIERFIRDSGAKLVNQDQFGKLWRKEVKNDEPIMMVEVVNATEEGLHRMVNGKYTFVPSRDAQGNPVFSTYFLRVPPNMTSAHEAVAWSFGKTKEQYAPLAET